MYRCRNFRMLLPDSEEVRLYGSQDIVIEEGRPMARTVQDVDLYMRMEEAWCRLFRDAVKNDRNLFAGPQYRLSSYGLLPDGKLLLRLGPTDYREFVGTNMEAGKDPEYMKALIERGMLRLQDENAFFSNTMAICSAIETSDGKVVAGLRGDRTRVAEYGRAWHTIGGHPNPSRFAPTRADLIDAMTREITGELLIEEEDITDIRAAGLVRNGYTRKPELLFTSRIGLPFSAIKESRIADGKDEHFMFFGLDGPEELADFLRKNQANFTFPEGARLTDEERAIMTPDGLADNTSNHFCPPGEACWTVYLMQKGMDIRRELPHLEPV